LNQLADFDPLDELSPEVELAAGKGMAFALIQACQGEEDDGKPPWQRFAALGIEAPQKGFDQTTMVAAFDRAWPAWRGHFK